MLRIDHVLYAVNDLDAAAQRLAAQLGLRAGGGGSHPSWGTANRIVALGADYLELIGIADPEVASASPFGRLVGDAVRDGDRLVGWAVATDDIEADARRLGIEVAPGARTLPDGAQLTWRLAGVERSLASAGALPFFIQWDGPPARHPGGGTASPGIAWVEVGEGRREELRAWLGGADLPLRFAAGADGIVAAGIGDVVLR